MELSDAEPMANPVSFVDDLDTELARLRRDLSLAHQRADELDRENTDLRKRIEFLEFERRLAISKRRAM